MVFASGEQWLELRQGSKRSKSPGRSYGPRTESASGAEAYISDVNVIVRYTVFIASIPFT